MEGVGKNMPCIGNSKTHLTRMTLQLPSLSIRTFLLILVRCLKLRIISTLFLQIWANLT